MKQGIIYRGEGMFNYQGWPSVCRDENGVLYAAWSGGRMAHVCPIGKNFLSTSTDGGETWSCPAIANDSPMDDRDAGITYLGGGRMLLSWFTLPIKRVQSDAPGQKRGRSERFGAALDALAAVPEDYAPEKVQVGSFVRISGDYGRTWAPQIRVPVTAPHGPVLTASGRLLYLGKIYIGNSTVAPAEDDDRIALYESFDGGESWELVSFVPVPEGYGLNTVHEPHIAELPNGDLLASVRFHAPFTTYFCRSADGGKTWSAPLSLGTNASPPHLLVLKDGRVLITYGRRCAPYGIVAQISDDNGATWGEELYLSHADCGDLGYPASAQLDDGSIVTVYYQRCPGDIDTSIMYTKWTVDEMPAGK